MKKFALNFICKNESHVITRMLDSVKPLADLIVALDTGSTDNTITLIKDYGAKHNIPTFVFERPFDDFGSSRNAALDMLLKCVDLLQWPRNETWGFWIDCDEIIMTNQQFSKDQVESDFYYIQTTADDLNYLKQFLFSLDKYFRWVGPVHEYLIFDKKTITSNVIKNIAVIYNTDGASWKGSLEKKFLNYAEKLNAFIIEGNYIFRWMLYRAESYSLAAENCVEIDKRREYLLLSKQYYNQIFNLEQLTSYQKYRLFTRIYENQLRLEEDWTAIKSNMLKTYQVDSRFVDPVDNIAKYYMLQEQWHTAQIYSALAYDEYHQKAPTGSDIVELKSNLYTWKILFINYLIAINLQMPHASLLYENLIKIIEKQPGQINKPDLQTIRLHTPSFIKFKIIINKIRKRSKMKHSRVNLT